MKEFAPAATTVTTTQLTTAVSTAKTEVIGEASTLNTLAKTETAINDLKNLLGEGVTDVDAVINKYNEIKTLVQNVPEGTDLLQKMNDAVTESELFTGGKIKPELLTDEVWSDTQFEKVGGVNQIKESYLNSVIAAWVAANGGVTPTQLASPTVSFGTKTANSIVVNWTAVTNATSYTVKRNTSNTETGASTIYTGNLLTFTDTGRSASTTYYYFVVPTATGYTPGTAGSGSAATIADTAPAGTYLLAVDGNSLIAGFNANGNGASDAVSSKTDTSKNDPVNYLRQDSAFASGWTLRNYGISGRQTTDSITQASSANWVDADYSGVNYSKNILIFSEITNDLANNPNHTIEQAIQNIRTYCLARKAVGFVVGVTDMLPRTSFLESYAPGAAVLEQARLVIKDWLIRNAKYFCDKLILISELGLTTTEGTHLNAAGYQTMAINGFKPAAIAMAGGSTDYVGGNDTPNAPTNLTIDDTNNTADWTYSPGYISPIFYQYSTDNGSTYNQVTSKPITGITGAIASGSFKLRVKADTGRNASPAVSSTAAFTGAAVVANMYANSNLATGWFAQSGAITTNDPQTAPDGGSPSAYPVGQSNGTTGRQGIKPPSDPTLVAATQYTLSIFAKPYAGGQNWIYLKFWDGSQDRFAWFDVLNGVQGSTSGTGITRGISAAGNGFYRCYMTVTAAGNGDTYFGLANADAVSSITGDITKKAVMYGPMLNVGGLATYTKTP